MKEHSLQLTLTLVPHALQEVSPQQEVKAAPTVLPAHLLKTTFVQDALQEASLKTQRVTVLHAQLDNSPMSMPPYVLPALMVLLLLKEA